MKTNLTEIDKTSYDRAFLTCTGIKRVVHVCCQGKP